MRGIILVIGLCAFAVATAQTFSDKRDSTYSDSTRMLNVDYFKTHFLWFTGNWNDQKNVFSTIASTDTVSGDGLSVGGDGIKLTVSSQGTIAIQSHNLDEWNKKIEEGLALLQKEEDSLKMPSNDAKEWAHHFNGVLLPELNAIKEEWKDYKVLGKELMNSKPDSKQSQNTKSYRNVLFNSCEQMRPGYEKVMAFYNAHKKDKQKDLTYVPPPAYSNMCLACDTSLARLYEIQDSMYAEKFFEPESDLTRTALGMLKQMSLLGIDKVIAVNPNDEEGAAILDAFKSSKNPSQAGPCNYFHYDELMEAVQFLVRRNYYKAEKLFNDYSKNVETARPVIKTYLSATRDAEMFGVLCNDNSNFAGVAGLLAREVDYYLNQKLLHDHDWSQLANIPFIYSLEREKELTGGGETEVFQKIGELLNGFHLRIEMDIKVGKENKAYQITHLKGETKITPEFNYDKDTCYRWVAIEDQPDLRYGFPRPVKKASQKIECDLLTNEMVAPGPHPVYAGTKKYYALLYGLKMDYCHPDKDTILLSSFIAEPNANAGIWNIPMSPPQAMGTWQIEHLFQDVSTMKELGLSGKAKQQADIMKQQGEQIAAQMKAIQAQMGNKRDASNLENLHKIQDLATKAMSLGGSVNTAPILYIDLPLQIQNNTNTLQDKRYDAKEINPEAAPGIIYGYYTVKIVYEKQNE